MARKYPPRTCVNPDCALKFTPHRRNHIYCTEQCRINFNNDKGSEKKQTDHKLEKVIKNNEKILKKVLKSPYYQNDEIRAEFLYHEHFDFDVSSDSKLNKKNSQVIRWCHTHGIELKKENPRKYSIHTR